MIIYIAYGDTNLQTSNFIVYHIAIVTIINVCDFHSISSEYSQSLVLLLVITIVLQECGLALRNYYDNSHWPCTCQKCHALAHNWQTQDLSE